MRLIGLLLALSLLAACGRGDPEEQPDIRTIDQATVTDVPGKDGPVLCTGAVAESAPPQCDGPVISNWDWSKTLGDGEKGSQFGNFCLAGHDEGDAFVLSALPRPVGTCGKQEYTATATVLEDSSHGPQLCLGAIEMSLPIQCGGPDIPNWTWDLVEGATTRGATSDGEFEVHGVYADGEFTLTRPPAAADEGNGNETTEPTVQDFTTPCPEPEGGWFPDGRSGPAKEDGAEKAAGFAASLPGYSEVWLDQSNNDGIATDDNRIILNLRVTKDANGAERAMRKVWPGALCVTVAKNTDEELRGIQDEVARMAGSLTLTASSGDDSVDILVIVDVGGTLQKTYDEKYGEGVVRVNSALKEEQSRM